MNNVLRLVADRPSLDPCYLGIKDLIAMVEQAEGDAKSQAFLVGVLCAVALKAILTNFGEAEKTINKIQNQGIKQMLLGVLHARMMLNNFDNQKEIKNDQTNKHHSTLNRPNAPVSNQCKLSKVEG